MRALAVAVTIAVVALVVGAPAVSARAGRTPSGAITVSAAASLTAAFTKLGRDFERRNPNASVAFNFGSSAALVTQIEGGAPTDVFASADLDNMDKLVSSGDVTATPAPFARNEMEIAVKPGNPKRVKTVPDLAHAGTVALCGATVPCGVYAARVLENANVSIPESSITRSADATATLGTVSHGDADAAVVYVTDVLSAGSTVTGVTIPGDENVHAIYPIAPVEGTTNRAVAKAFVASVLSPAGQKTLAKYGFLAP